MKVSKSLWEKYMDCSHPDSDDSQRGYKAPPGLWQKYMDCPPPDAATVSTESATAFEIIADWIDNYADRVSE